MVMVSPMRAARPNSRAMRLTVAAGIVVMLSVCSFCNRTRHWFPTVEGERVPLAVPADAPR